MLVLCTYRDTISRKLYQFKICQNPYLPREIWTHITPPYHTPEFFFILSFFHLKLCWESCISSKFVKIHISLGRYGDSYHIFTVKYILFTYAIQAQVLCTYRDTISRKLYQFKICQNPYLPREIWTHITPPYHTPNLESCISSKFVKIHISLGRYGLISHPHITPQTSYHISRDPHIRSALFYSIVRCKLFSIYKSNFCI